MMMREIDALLLECEEVRRVGLINEVGPQAVSDHQHDDTAARGVCGRPGGARDDREASDYRNHGGAQLKDNC